MRLFCIFHNIKKARIGRLLSGLQPQNNHFICYPFLTKRVTNESFYETLKALLERTQKIHLKQEAWYIISLEVS